MPITVTDHSAEDRAKRRADMLRLASRETLRTITLPVGRPHQRRIEVVRVEQVASGHPDADTQVIGRAVLYELAGDLELFGCDLWDTIPLHAASDADACRQAVDMVRARWVRECGGGDESEGDAAALGG